MHLAFTLPRVDIKAIYSSDHLDCFVRGYKNIPKCTWLLVLSWDWVRFKSVLMCIPACVSCKIQLVEGYFMERFLQGREKKGSCGSLLIS